MRIALRSRSVLGIVANQVSKPSFTVKPISAVAPSLPLPEQLFEMINWMYAYYPAPFGAIVRLFMPPTSAFSNNRAGASLAPSKKPVGAPSVPPAPLTPEQASAVNTITSSGYHLLHGITGSGKTRVYLELVQRTLEDNKSAIILTPEIGLTAQLTEPFEQQHPGKVLVLHSRLTVAQRRDLWYRIINAQSPVIVIGPRSALFAPVRHLGLIVIDESHDQAYKSETTPRYRAERVAGTLAQFHNASIVSGTATPNIEDYYVARAKNRPIITLSRLAVSSGTNTRATIVDLRDKSNLSRSRILSTPLILALQGALQQKEQGLLFLNRRGTAGAVICSHCGWQSICDHCDLPLTYHGDSHQLRCHVCGRTRPLPSSCPECQKTDILLKTVGTKAVVDEVRRLFPEARIVRFDTDTERHEQLETQHEALQSGAVDIIIGTQMITKGLDLPKLSVVGVLNADSSLLVPDYTSNERTYQLLTQVIGRANRGHRSGHVIVQSYAPHHPVIEAAASQDWTNFYANELAERQAYRFPPFVYLLKLNCVRAKSQSAESAATKLRIQIQKSHPRLNIEGPAAAFHPRENGQYKWQLIIKAASRRELIEIINDLPSGWSHDLDPVNLL